MPQERDRLTQNGDAWKRWGPYLSERQWGTVREDYSENGDAWNYFPHDHARSRAYHWGEDGIAGVSDDKQRLCFAIALWNGHDPILKERLYGLTNGEGNHGEDVKEYYYYLDSTPTHSSMKYLYKYPQRAFPYDDLIQTNGRRGKLEPEYELIDTGIFDDDRYFDVFIEYAKASPDDLLVTITAHNRGPEAAELHVLPTLWFRNTWSWSEGSAKPSLRAEGATVIAEHQQLGDFRLTAEGTPTLLFTENETNSQRLFGSPNASPFVKDAFHDYVVHGYAEAVNPAQTGSKAAAHYQLDIPSGEQATIRVRLSQNTSRDPFGPEFAATFAARRNEADEFYASITPPATSADAAAVMRQALAGMLWSKQYFYYDVDRWLEEHHGHPLIRGDHDGTRNRNWYHMLNDDIISMPDKWEYPWYAAWDLAFHAVALSIVDPDFAREQLDLMLRERYLHPNGQIPAYEWAFDDVNPPVHAWATLFLTTVEDMGALDTESDFLRTSFRKLLLNFNWWINRKDRFGRNVFEGGFLGMDNIGLFDRSAPLSGGYLEQADGTAWMALFCQNMLEMALELTATDASYQDIAMRFFQQFVLIASAMDRVGEGHDEMWDEEDGFFYDVLRYPNGAGERLKVRSMVGLLPLCAVTVVSKEVIDHAPELIASARSFLARRPGIFERLAYVGQPGVNGRRIFAVLNEEKLRRVLSRVLDEEEFLSPYGIRSISRYHRDHPYVLNLYGRDFSVGYEPAESASGMFGGNSNWRGPIWMPVNLLVLRALFQYYSYYGDDFTIECPTGSGNQMTLFEVGMEIANRIIRIFLKDDDGRRPVFGGADKFQTDPNWVDHILFYEYFHGDNGSGIGASHQTGWTGLVAALIRLVGTLTPETVLRDGVRHAAAAAVSTDGTVKPVVASVKATP